MLVIYISILHEHIHAHISPYLKSLMQRFLLLWLAYLYILKKDKLSQTFLKEYIFNLLYLSLSDSERQIILFFPILR